MPLFRDVQSFRARRLVGDIVVVGQREPHCDVHFAPSV